MAIGGSSMNLQIVMSLQDRASAGLDKIEDNIEDIGGAAGGSVSSLGDFSSAIAGFGALITASGILELGKAAWEMGELGAASLDSKAAFDSMISSVGAAPGLLEDMRSAAGGTVSDLEIMRGASLALAGTQGNMSTAMAEAQPAMLEIARAAYKMNPALGSVTHMYQSLNTGIKRNSPMLIDNLGIVVKLGQAQEQYAAKLGKAVGDLTDEEKQMALLNATLEGGQRLIQQVGGDVTAASDAFQRAGIASEELKTTWAEMTVGPMTRLANLGIDVLKGTQAMTSGNWELTKAYVNLQAAQNLYTKSGGRMGEQWFNDAIDAYQLADAANRAGMSVEEYTASQEGMTSSAGVGAMASGGGFGLVSESANTAATSLRDVAAAATEAEGAVKDIGAEITPDIADSMTVEAEATSPINDILSEWAEDMDNNLAITDMGISFATQLADAILDAPELGSVADAIVVRILNTLAGEVQ